MKWFKHMTDSADDEKLASLIGTHGLEGYGVWWFIVEVVAKQVPKGGTKCSVSYPLSYWIRLTGIYHHSKLKNIFQSMHNLSLIFAQCPDNVGNISALSMKDVLTISIPNILKFRDEYSRKSGHAPDFVRPKKERENKEEDTDKNKTLKTVAESVKKPTRPTATKLSDEDWMEQTINSPAYEGIDVKREIAKCQQWCINNGRQASRKRIINWLNRAEKPMAGVVIPMQKTFADIKEERGRDQMRQFVEEMRCSTPI